MSLRSGKSFSLFFSARCPRCPRPRPRRKHGSVADGRGEGGGGWSEAKRRRGEFRKLIVNYGPGSIFRAETFAKGNNTCVFRANIRIQKECPLNMSLAKCRFPKQKKKEKHLKSPLFRKSQQHLRGSLVASIPAIFSPLASLLLLLLRGFRGKTSKSGLAPE